MSYLEVCKTCDGGALINGATTYDWAQWDGATPATTCIYSPDGQNIAPLANPPSTFDITNPTLTDSGSTADTCRASFTCTGTDPLVFHIVTPGDQEACIVLPLSLIPVSERTVECSDAATPPPGGLNVVAMGCGVPA
ncbi:hypothetical protein WR25_22440 [Diploscapter pachys]|uniref:Uncharacterized protein n=1 Tax=Diploscapter pachys TaxID=2018661 RepID=A0A2A2LU54_9BILA|nr:hypothetical protein WR25_22440 [Diploscapter pachys]